MLTFSSVYADDGIKVTIDGKAQSYDVMPVIVDSRTLVPMRAIFEALGAEVAWDDTTKTVTGTKGDVSVVLTIGNTVAKVNGNDATLDVINDLSQKVSILKEKGVKDIIIDPGFGFSKTLEQNYTLLNNLEKFHSLNAPLLVGVSRKSMIYNTLGGSPDTALNGTTVINTLAIAKGAHILRVHDVKEAVEAVKLTTKTLNS